MYGEVLMKDRHGLRCLTALAICLKVGRCTFRTASTVGLSGNGDLSTLPMTEDLHGRRFLTAQDRRLLTLLFSITILDWRLERTVTFSGRQMEETGGMCKSW